MKTKTITSAPETRGGTNYGKISAGIIFLIISLAAGLYIYHNSEDDVVGGLIFLSVFSGFGGIVLVIAGLVQSVEKKCHCDQWSDIDSFDTENNCPACQEKIAEVKEKEEARKFAETRIAEDTAKYGIFFCPSKTHSSPVEMKKVFVKSHDFIEDVCPHCGIILLHVEELKTYVSKAEGKGYKRGYEKGYNEGEDSNEGSGFASGLVVGAIIS